MRTARPISLDAEEQRSRVLEAKHAFAGRNAWSGVSAARLVRDGRGAVAVEFAIVASILVVSILFILSAGLMLYLNQAMDFATAKAARQIMIGAAQNAGATQATFNATYICPYLPAVLNCGNLTVNIYTVAEAAQPNGYYAFANANQTSLLVPTPGTSTQFSLGGRGAYQYLQVLYPITFLPAFFTSRFSNGVTYNGSPAVVVVSTAAFRNEQY